MRVLGRILDGIDTVTYACAGALLLIGSGVWIFMKVAEVDPNLAVASALGLAVFVGGTVVHDLKQRRLSTLTKFVLVAWMGSTVATLALDFIITLQS
jgi:hypothetical protein